MKETKIILSLIYRSYLCDIDTKKKLLQQDSKELNKIKEENKKKYNTKTMF